MGYNRSWNGWNIHNIYKKIELNYHKIKKRLIRVDHFKRLQLQLKWAWACHDMESRWAKSRLAHKLYIYVDFFGWFCFQILINAFQVLEMGFHLLLIFDSMDIGWESWLIEWYFVLSCLKFCLKFLLKMMKNSETIRRIIHH